MTLITTVEHLDYAPSYMSKLVVYGEEHGKEREWIFILGYMLRIEGLKE